MSASATANETVRVRVAGHGVRDERGAAVRGGLARTRRRCAAPPAVSGASETGAVVVRGGQGRGAHRVPSTVAASRSAMAARSLSPRPERPSSTMASSVSGAQRRRARPASAPSAAMAWAGSSAGRMPSVRVSVRMPSIASSSVARQDLQPARLEHRRELGADARVVEARRDGVGLLHLAVVVLEQVAQRSRGARPASRPRARRRGWPWSPSPAASTPTSAHRRLTDEARQQADGVGAAADARDRDVRQPALDLDASGRRPRRR